MGVCFNLLSIFRLLFTDAIKGGINAVEFLVMPLSDAIEGGIGLALLFTQAIEGGIGLALLFTQAINGGIDLALLFTQAINGGIDLAKFVVMPDAGGCHFQHQLFDAIEAAATLVTLGHRTRFQ